jgi:hypothetical protein
MTTFYGLIVLSIIIGFVLIALRDTNESKQSVKYLINARGLKVDASFGCVPTGNILFDFSASRLGFANATFPLKGPREFNQPTLKASLILDFTDIRETQIWAAPNSNLYNLRLFLHKPNLINSETKIEMFIDVRGTGEENQLHQLFERAGLIAHSTRTT